MQATLQNNRTNEMVSLELPTDIDTYYSALAMLKLYTPDDLRITCNEGSFKNLKITQDNFKIFNAAISQLKELSHAEYMKVSQAITVLRINDLAHLYELVSYPERINIRGDIRTVQDVGQMALNAMVKEIVTDGLEETANDTTLTRNEKILRAIGILDRGMQVMELQALPKEFGKELLKNNDISLCDEGLMMFVGGFHDEHEEEYEFEL